MSSRLGRPAWRPGIFSAGLAQSIERALDRAGLDRAPWLAVGFGGGIGWWFALDDRGDWLGLIALGLGMALGAAALLRGDGRYPHIRLAVMAMGLMVAGGCATIWTRSVFVGTPPIARITVPWLTGRVLERTDELAQDRVRLVLATREPRTERLIRVRVSVPAATDRPGLVPGAVVRLRARLLPPAAPAVPGSFDFARAAWFAGVSGVGGVIGPIEIVAPAPADGWIARARAALAAHVRAALAGSAGGIAAVITTGERGGIAADDAQAMRDTGLAHLLVVGGLHVGAVTGLAWLLALRLLALVPALALRVRLPVLAAGVGALAGIGYTLLTGAQVSTVRACLGTLLVLAALALGRQPLSLRLLATAALAVMLVWPEAVVGPGFQMSFGSVLAIIALHEARPVRAFLARRTEPWPRRMLREAAMLLLTGLVIDLTMMPIALYHFHRAGFYGALANLLAIPLTTFVVIPALAVALLLDLVGWGTPVWWLTGRALGLLLAIAHRTAALPGSVTVLPNLGTARFAVFLAAMLWLALWRGRSRLWALVPAVLAGASLAWLRAPDVLITGDGRNLGIVTGDGTRLMILRHTRRDITRDEMLEVAGMAGQSAMLDTWPGARCTRDLCLVELHRGRRNWRLLVARRRVTLPDEALARACASVDIVIAPQALAEPCHPALLLADRTLLLRTGGLALDLDNRRITSVAAGQGAHPWWRPMVDDAGSATTDMPPSPDNANPTADIVKGLPN